MFEAIKEFITRPEITDLEYSYRGHQVWQYLNQTDFSDQEIRYIQKVHGYDVASWVLYKCFKERVKNKKFLTYLDSQREMIYSRDLQDYVVVAAVHNPWVSLKKNEDYQWQLKSIATDAGFECCYPEVPYRRSIFPNAYYYQDVLKRFAGKKIIFMTHSQAGLEVRWLLERSQQLEVDVVGWLNISGMLYGTSLPPSSEAWWNSFRRYFNDDHPVLPEVARSNAYCYGDLKLQQDVPLVSMLGFKPAKYLTLGQTLRDREIRFWGPHDGFISHSDYLKSNEIVWPVLGHDHFIEVQAYRQQIQATLKGFVTGEIKNI